VEADVAMTDHQKAQKAFHENRERLKAERLARKTKLNEPSSEAQRFRLGVLRADKARSALHGLDEDSG
jgi:hypothetical protein